MNDAAPTPDVPPAPDPLAVVLAKLDPAPHGFDRDALMFSAGQASKLNALFFWRVATAVALTAAAAFAALYATRPVKIEYHERQVVVDPGR
ncbi:hypothetical protein [Gemmata sp.]|uniref:hypothetical protein n=1 Tax=Gemmata sp. TaxID=1914242 RepID=UPI003F728A6E